jgi:sugar lactone lactonase YvrE
MGGYTIFQGINGSDNSETYIHYAMWGTRGQGPGEFDYPGSITISHDNYIYVCDSHNYRIQKFTLDGTLVNMWGSLGSGPGQFFNMFGIAVDSQNNVYVSDYWNYRIQKFDENGVYLDQWGSHGSGPGQFHYQHTVEIDQDDFIYVCDTGNHRIQKFTTDGVFIMQWGSYGSAPGQLYDPTGITFDDEGFIYVSEHNNHRVQKFTSDGTHVAMWGSYGSAPGQFKQPHEITFHDNHLFVVDTNNGRVQKFTTDGTFVTEFGTVGSNPGELYGPLGIAIDWRGRVYIGEENNHRIQVFLRPLAAEITITPKTLNLASNGRWLSARIELPMGYTPDQIDTTSISMQIGDHTIYPVAFEYQDTALIAKFERTDIADALVTYDYPEETGRFKIAYLTITGTLLDGTPFSGTDSIRVIT